MSLTNDIGLFQRSNTNLEEGDLIVVVRAHVEEVVLIGHKIMANMPRFLINN